jgi:hypothetical protein
MRLTSGVALSQRNSGADMYYENGSPRPHFVSIKTGKQYFYREGTGEDRLRALRELERDDTPPPEPEPELVSIVPVRPRPMDLGVQARLQLDEMKLRGKQ